MANRPVRAARFGEVTRVEQLTPHMVRVVVGGAGLSGMSAGEFTDHYVKLYFPPPGTTYPEPFDLAVIRETMPRERQPLVRTYTVRRWLPEVPELWIDFVVHGDAGIAGPWAAGARPGDPVRFMGPGGGYAPDPDADWHLLAGDESALPAIAVALERMPAGARVRAFIEVEDPAEEQKLETSADAEITWLHRGARPHGELLVPAVRGLDFPAGRVHAFVHGEATFVKDLRALLRVEHALPMSQLSISGYWRRGLNEDGWQSTKREWNQQIEREQEAEAG
ncbi:siderophore-interacting protein [Amorphoplanes digitatis]|uniref:NADPH-dependent ferric siderophore reductase n=1 Tax=Actinoplanes digitatis TaxID=1868 RepID=A0A7W7HWP7_9ACTN|nr:siderophore-interacting protein [Actinoplanes digitatis]MBB4762123.1 NADPH-dependent ferric siderophore reductase [Actinoplanes digitatis]GID96221.1 siderophore-interacting protein [Actinoplanes digitatis]